MNEISKIDSDDDGNRSLIVRGQQLAVTLGETARNLGFKSTSRRSMYQVAGIRPRPRDKIFHFLLLTGFFVLLVFPIVFGSVYYSFIANDVFESETRFVVRSAIPAIPKKESTSQTGSPDVKIAQDTQVVTNFIKSPKMVEQIDQVFGMQNLFGGDDVDFISRIDGDASSEDYLDYWEDQVETFIDLRSGIVTVSSFAFTAETAQNILKEILRSSEQKVNELNAGIWDELIASAEKDLDVARANMDELRIKLREEQNSSGIFDVELLAETTTGIIGTIRLEILELESRRKVSLAELSPNSSVIQDLDKQIAAREEQIEQLQDEIAGSSQKQLTIASYYAKFEALKVETKIAQEHFEKAVRELERVKLLSTVQLVYLDTFLPPTLPDSGTHPKRIAMISIVVLISLVVWGLFTSIVLSLRNRLD